MKNNIYNLLTAEDSIQLEESLLSRGLEETYQLMEELVQQRQTEEVLVRKY